MKEMRTNGENDSGVCKISVSLILVPPLGLFFHLSLLSNSNVLLFVLSFFFILLVFLRRLLIV